MKYPVIIKRRALVCVAVAIAWWIIADNTLSGDALAISHVFIGLAFLASINAWVIE